MPSEQLHLRHAASHAALSSTTDTGGEADKVRSAVTRPGSRLCRFGARVISPGPQMQVHPAALPLDVSRRMDLRPVDQQRWRGRRPQRDPILQECASSSSGADVTEGRERRGNRATSSRQPAGVSPVRGDARVPGSSTPGVGREPEVEAEVDRPIEGAGDWPVRSIKRSLQRRQESPRKRAKREPSPYSVGRRPWTAPENLERVPRNPPA